MKISVYEVGPRDGLQALKHHIPAQQKRDLIEALYAAGLEDVEETSFVSPKAVPQMADAADVFSGRGAVLVMNRRGFDDARKAGAEKINIVMSTCEEFNRRNMRKTHSELVHSYFSFLNGYPRDKVRVYISMAFGSPFSSVPSEKNMEMVVRDARMFGDTVVFSDTVGAAHPADVQPLADVAKRYDLKPALHLHHKGKLERPFSVIRAGIFAGISEFDSSIGGLGGCPFVENSGANIPTERLVTQLNAWGADTGLSPQSLGPAIKIAHAIRRSGADYDGVIRRSVDREGLAPLVQGEVGRRKPKRQGWETPALWPF